MDLGLEDKVAIVTAASTGLGKATAMELAAEGARVVITSRREGELRSAADEIRSNTGAALLAIAGDVTDEDHIRRLVSDTTEYFGGGVDRPKPPLVPVSISFAA